MNLDNNQEGRLNLCNKNQKIIRQNKSLPLEWILAVRGRYRQQSYHKINGKAKARKLLQFIVHKWHDCRFKRSHAFAWQYELVLGNQKQNGAWIVALITIRKRWASNSFDLKLSRWCALSVILANVSYNCINVWFYKAYMQQ